MCLYAYNQLIQQILVQMIYLIKLKCIRLFCNAMSYNPIISEAYDIFVYHHRVALCLALCLIFR